MWVMFKMITYKKFKELFNNLKHETEIEIYFKNNEKYMIIKYDNYLTFGKENGIKEKIKKYSSIDKLYNSFLNEKWNEITDILIDTTFSVIYNKQEIKDYYDIDL